MATQWQKEIIPEWMDQAKTYPVKALIYTAGLVHEEQQRRLESDHQKLDGMMWSPEEWG